MIQYFTGKPPEPTSTVVTLADVSPSCDASDPKIMWTAVGADISCMNGRTMVTKKRDWNGQADAGYAELRLTLKGQAFPRSYTVSLAVDNLSDPVTGANDLGCAALLVHTTSDGSTFDMASVRGDGSMLAVGILNFNGRNRVDTSVPSGEADGVGGGYNVVVTVNQDNVRMTTINKLGQSVDAATESIGASTSYISLAVVWRNRGATAAFSNFRYNDSE